MIEKLECSECGATVDIDVNGDGICTHCGSRFRERKIVNNIKNISNNVNVIQTDNLNYNDINIDNNLEILRHDFSSENFKHAEKVANKILEVNSALAEVWFIKGVSVGYQSTTVNPRFKEAYNCLIRASELDSEKYTEEMIYNRFLSLADSLIELSCNQMVKFVTNESTKTIFKNVEISQNYLSEFEKYCEKDLKDTYDYVHSNLELAFLSSQEDFGPDKSDKNRYAFETFIERCNAITELIESLLDNITINTVRVNLMELAIDIHETTIKTCSYKFDGVSSIGILDIPIYVRDTSLREDVIELKEQIIANYKDEIDEIKKCAIENYWKNHKKQKDKIDKKIAELNNQLEQEKQNYKSLGFFAIFKKMDSKKIMNEIKDKIQELEEEFTKDRL